ncbi:hypothetical protein Taro_039011 [Colocasia esculenta]|uniref:Uncharacterized protein n=1 Tax=Colocasia esculenta TaxID=4460 RepID=A0A843W9J7_COLES|nr:hypothetical protein [Colocasia esculenta]
MSNPVIITETPREISGIVQLTHRSGRELRTSVTRRPSAPQMGFIGLAVSAHSSVRSASTVTLARADLCYTCSNIGAVCGNRY